VTPAGDVDERKWEPVIEALSAAKRETDVIGWFESLATIGVILPETDASDPAVATEMVSRVRQELGHGSMQTRPSRVSRRFTPTPVGSMGGKRILPTRSPVIDLPVGGLLPNG